MDRCNIDNNEDGKVCKELFDEPETTSWKPLLRQVLISSGVWTIYFQLGLCFGTPTVLIPQMRREANSTDFISPEKASWLSSAYSYSALPWGLALPAIAWYFGRRVSHATIVLLSLAGYITLYFSETLTQIFIGLATLGSLGAYIVAVGLIIITEYVSPVNRGWCLTIKSASFVWGLWLANTIGTFFPWRNIAVLGLICGIYNALTLLAWPESPYWLADRGRLDECRQAFNWLRGNDRAAKRELDELVQILITDEDKKYRLRISKSIISKWFYKPIMLSILLLSLYQFTGKLVVSAYALDILGKITNIEHAYRGMLILDGVTVLGMYCGCGLSRILPRRVQLMATTSAGIVCLLLMSLYLFLIKQSLISENVYISVSLLSILSLSASCGPIMLSTTLCGELMPLKLRSVSAAIMSLFTSLSTGVILKLGPNLFATFGMDGGFLFFGASSLICLAVLYTYLPETKDRTLQEISVLISR